MKTSNILKASHYEKHENDLAYNMMVIRLHREFVTQGGTLESLGTFETLLIVNAQARKYKIDFDHIGAIKGAFIKISETNKEIIKALDEGFFASATQDFKNAVSTMPIMKGV